MHVHAQRERESESKKEMFRPCETLDSIQVQVSHALANGALRCLAVPPVFFFKGA